MAKKLKQALALLLAMSMVLSLLSVSAFAAEPDEHGHAEAVGEAAAEELTPDAAKEELNADRVDLEAAGAGAVEPAAAAKPTTPTITVNYHYNYPDGSTSVKTVSAKGSSAILVCPDDCSYEGYELVRWTTQTADASGDSYQDGDTYVSSTSATLNLYARWEKVVSEDEAAAYVEAEGNGRYYDTLQDALDAVYNAHYYDGIAEWSLTLLDDVNESVNVRALIALGQTSFKLTFDLNGHTITGNGGATITFWPLGSAGIRTYDLIIEDSAGTGVITGGAGRESYGSTIGGAIDVNGSQSTATLTIAGGTITGNTATGNGGAVWAGSGGKIVVSGGTITGNTAGDKGGAIYAKDLTVNGGAVYGNTADGMGDDIYVTRSLTLSSTGDWTLANGEAVTGWYYDGSGDSGSAARWGDKLDDDSVYSKQFTANTGSGNVALKAAHCPHNWVDVEEQPANCGNSGLTAGVVCSICGKVQEGRDVIPATGAHDYTDWTVTTEATYDAPGKKARSCTICNTAEIEEVPQLNYLTVAQTASAPAVKMAQTIEWTIEISNLSSSEKEVILTDVLRDGTAGTSKVIFGANKYVDKYGDPYEPIKLYAEDGTEIAANTDGLTWTVTVPSGKLTLTARFTLPRYDKTKSNRDDYTLATQQSYSPVKLYNTVSVQDEASSFTVRANGVQVNKSELGEFTHELVTRSMEDGPDWNIVSAANAYIPANMDETILVSDEGVTLLYKITVVGDPGALYKVENQAASPVKPVVVGENKLTGFVDGSGKTVIWVTRTFTANDISAAGTLNSSFKRTANNTYATNGSALTRAANIAAVPANAIFLGVYVNLHYYPVSYARDTTRTALNLYYTITDEDGNVVVPATQIDASRYIRSCTAGSIYDTEEAAKAIGSYLYVKFLVDAELSSGKVYTITFTEGNLKGHLGHELYNNPRTLDFEPSYETTYVLDLGNIEEDGTVKAGSIENWSRILKLNYNGNSEGVENVPDPQFIANMSSTSFGDGVYINNDKAVFTIPDQIPTRVGYSFLGWSENSDTTAAVYQPGGEYTVTEHTALTPWEGTLYAVWAECSHENVTYTTNGNGAHNGVCDDCGAPVAGHQEHTLDSKNQCELCGAKMFTLRLKVSTSSILSNNNHYFVTDDYVINYVVRNEAGDEILAGQASKPHGATGTAYPELGTLELSEGTYTVELDPVKESFEATGVYNDQTTFVTAKATLKITETTSAKNKQTIGELVAKYVDACATYLDTDGAGIQTDYYYSKGSPYYKVKSYEKDGDSVAYWKDSTGRKVEVGALSPILQSNADGTKYVTLTAVYQSQQINWTLDVDEANVNALNGIYDGQNHRVNTVTVTATDGNGKAETFEVTPNADSIEWNGHTVRVDASYVRAGNAVTASYARNAGDYTVTYTLRADGETVAASEPYTFSIAKAPLTVKTGSAVKTYDGTALTAAECELAGLMAGDEDEVYSFKATGSLTDAGAVENTYTLTFKTYSGPTGSYRPADNYEISEELGVLTVEKALLIVTTESAVKIYDGQPLTAEGHVEGLVEADAGQVTLNVTGTQTEIGSSENTYELIWGETSPDNYEIQEELGTLTVNREIFISEIVIPSTPEPSEDPGEDITDPDNPPLSGAPVETIFADLAEGAWYISAVQFVYDNGIMDGVGGGSFAPGTNTTRGMVVTILHRMENKPSAAAGSFNDVLADKYYTDAVNWAAEQGIIKGYGNGSFGPEDNVTREQFVAILYRYAQLRGYDVSARADLSAFTDAGMVSEYAVEAMSWANAVGLIRGTSTTTLSPAAMATRAQVAAILMRFNENVAPKANDTV